LLKITSDAIVDYGLKKSQKWLIESFREVVKGDVTHMAILKDLEESFRKASKEDHEVWSSEEDRELETTKEELERVLGGHWLGSTSVPFSSMLEKQDANSAGALALERGYACLWAVGLLYISKLRDITKELRKKEEFG
jgi:hypothetical protein